MGTTVALQVLGEDPAAAASAADAALDRMTALERLLSRYDAASELSTLHRDGIVPRASAALRDVLALADRISALGDDAFDVTVQPVLDVHRAHLQAGRAAPSEAELVPALDRVDRRAIRMEGETVRLARPDVRLTLDGIGKGYVVDQAVATLRRLGFGAVFVEAGGDLVAGGEKAAGVPWRIGIRSPRAPGLQARFEARERAVATSGDYMQPFSSDYRQHHIVDPRTGRSAPELASATVVAPDCATADALATLVLVLGARRGRALLEDLPGCEGYLVGKDLAVTRTSGFRTT